MEQNESKAQSNLGEVYNEGEGIPRDVEQAIHYYKLAADQNNVDDNSILVITLIKLFIIINLLQIKDILIHSTILVFFMHMELKFIKMLKKLFIIINLHLKITS